VARQSTALAFLLLVLRKSQHQSKNGQVAFSNDPTELSVFGVAATFQLARWQMDVFSIGLLESPIFCQHSTPVRRIASLLLRSAYQEAPRGAQSHRHLARHRYVKKWKGLAMPLIHISMRAGKPEAYRQAIFDGLYRAMREALNVPDDDQFMTITEHDAANFRYGAAYGISRSNDLVFIQITVFDTRTSEQKKALFRWIAELLGESPGIRPEDVFVNIVDAAKENWSVGNGLAQFA
jgi:phenylpyruvate tautomerase PptA (4-oxalocrotonate tautomerase family)